jgi:hypothetical protein
MTPPLGFFGVSQAMLAFLEKLATGFWTTIWRVVSLITPFFSQSQYLRQLGRGLAWTLHVIFVLAIIVGLWFLNQYWELGVMVRSPGMRRLHLEKAWLPVLFILVYLLGWLGFWLWKLLGPEEDLIEFGDISEAWDEGVRTLNQAGIDVTEAPLFFVLGKPKAQEDALFAGAQLQLTVKQAPQRGDAPLHVYASRDAIFVTCPGASLIGRQAGILNGEGGPGADGPLANFGLDGDDPFKTLQPKGKLKDVQGVLARARDQGRDPSQLTDVEKEEIRVLLAEERADAVRQGTVPRVHLLKNAAEVEVLTARLRYLCRLIVRDRKPYCPINGIMLLVPFAAMDTDDDANQTGAICQQDLATARRAFQVNCPVFALVTDLESASGFKEFMDRFPSEQRQRRLGQRLPLAPDLAEGETVTALVDKSAAWLCNQLFPTYIYRLFRVEAGGREEMGAVVQGNARLFQLMYQMRERRARLGRVLSRALGGEQKGPPLFGGCYIAGTGRDPGREQAFIAGVFRRLTENQNFVSWTQEAQEEDVKYQNWTRYGYAGIGLFAAVVIALLVVVYMRS